MTFYTHAAGIYMGFHEGNRVKQFFYPFVHLHDCRRIALYGSGHVGKEYHSEIKKLGICEIAVWASKNWEKERENGLDVSPVDSLLTAEYDYVVIAVEREEMAREIKTELIQLGLDKERLLWKKPIYIVNL